MSLMIKICGITRREDAEAAAAFGADALGFIFYPSSPRYVRPNQVAELADGLAPLKVGVFVRESAASVKAVMRAARLDVAQIYGDEFPQGVRVWRAFRVSAPLDPALAEGVEAVLVDGPSHGVTFNWSYIPSGPKVILAGGLSALNVTEAVRMVRPWGVDASSGLESSPGIKDPEKVRQFIEAARKAVPV
jgi:phosphoribosylanthranilate isomerase